MKMRNKLSAIFAAILTIGLLAGCGSKVDASGYVKSVLDVRYKNDSTTYVEMGLGTKEEAEKVYQEGLDDVVDEVAAELGLSDELATELKDTYKQVFASVKYTVGEAEKQSDGSYVVTVTYEKMNFYVPFAEEYERVLTEEMKALTDKVMAGEVVYSEEEMQQALLDLIFGTMNSVMLDTISDITYDEPQTMTITVTIEDNTYYADEDDLEELDSLIDDMSDANM